MYEWVGTINLLWAFMVGGLVDYITSFFMFMSLRRDKLCTMHNFLHVYGLPLKPQLASDLHNSGESISHRQRCLKMLKGTHERPEISCDIQTDEAKIKSLRQIKTKADADEQSLAVTDQGSPPCQAPAGVLWHGWHQTCQRQQTWLKTRAI